MSTLKRIGLFIFLFDICMLGVHGLFLSFNLHDLLDISHYSGNLFWIYVILLTGSFLVMYFAAKIDSKRKKSDSINDSSNIMDQISKDEEINAEFLAHQQEYIVQDANGRGQTIPFIRISLIIYIVLVSFYLSLDVDLTAIGISFGFDSILKGIYIYSLASFIISVAFLVAKMSGNITEDVMRTYIFGYHIHESVLGIVLILVGIPLLAGSDGFFSAEFPFGLSFISAGVFLIGRDWQDVVRGDILVHRRYEEDYNDYLRLTNLKKDAERQNSEPESTDNDLITKIKEKLISFSR